MPTTPDYLMLSQAAHTTGGAVATPPPGWKVIDSQTTSNGMRATAFQNTTTGEVVIAYEGTNLSNSSVSNFVNYLGPQLRTDAAIGSGINPAANADALTFAQQVAQEAGGNPVYLTGHSLGGEEAEYVEANAGSSDLTIKGGAVFGAPGVPQLSLPYGNNSNFTDYIDYGDLIGGFVPTGGTRVGNVVMVGNPYSALSEAQELNDDSFGSLLGMALSYHSLRNYGPVANCWQGVERRAGGSITASDCLLIEPFGDEANGF